MATRTHARTHARTRTGTRAHTRTHAHARTHARARTCAHTTSNPRRDNKDFFHYWDEITGIQIFNITATLAINDHYFLPFCLPHPATDLIGRCLTSVTDGVPAFVFSTSP